MARMAWSAAITPRLVRSLRRPSVSSFSTRVPSKIRTPRSSSTRRRPRARSAGWTDAALGMSSPSRKAGDAHTRRTAAGSTGWSWSPGTDRAEALDGLVPVGRLVRERVHAQVAGLDEVRVDPVLRAPLTDAVDDFIGLARDLERGVCVEALGQVGEALPPAVDEAAVASGRPAAADVLLDEHDPRVGAAFADEVGGPHAGVAAADDRDVGIGVGCQDRGRWWIAFGGQRLAQPPAALPARDRQIGRGAAVKGSNRTA